MPPAAFGSARLFFLLGAVPYFWGRQRFFFFRRPLARPRLTTWCHQEFHAEFLCGQYPTKHRAGIWVRDLLALRDLSRAQCQCAVEQAMRDAT